MISSISADLNQELIAITEVFQFPTHLFQDHKDPNQDPNNTDLRTMWARDASAIVQYPFRDEDLTTTQGNLLIMGLLDASKDPTGPHSPQSTPKGLKEAYHLAVSSESAY